MNDITLNNVGYSVAPGSYRKRSATLAMQREVRRLEVGPFGAGQRQAMSSALRLPSSVPIAWDGLAVGPCFGGQAK